MMRNHLVIFVKAPQWGRVKTRLARDIGAMAAWCFYRRTTAALIQRLAADRRWQVHLAVTPDGFAQKGRFWRQGLQRIPQGRGDLGARMFKPVYDLPPGPVVIVGSDIPGIRRDHIAAAFRALGCADAVFGPAEDGGYWLAGMRRRPRVFNLFEGVRWSGPHALADTLANMPHGTKTAFVETLRDVDIGADYVSISRGMISTKLQGR